MRYVAAALVLFAVLPSGSSAQSRTTAPSAADIFKRISQAVVTVTTPTGFGSGVLLDPTGVLVTNLHVIKGTDRVAVRLSNGDAYDDVAVIEFDNRKDLVLLKIKGFKLPSAEFGDSDDLVVGQRVYAIGAPKGLELTLSEGIVSGLRDTGEGFRVVQTSAAISPGSSGGGLFDERGRLIAVTSFKIGGGENLNFALPVNYVRGMLTTTPKLTLTELKSKLTAESAESTGSVAAPDTLATTGGVPRLANLYQTAQGVFAVVEQDGETVHISFTLPNGYIYGSSTLQWVATAKAFKGQGVLDTVCGVYDTRVWKAPVQEEIYIVNDRVIRDRWTQPVKVNCSRGQVISSTWQEGLWYVPDPGR